MSTKYIPNRKAQQILGVCAHTLRNWAKAGKIRYIKTPSGQRLFDVSSIDQNTGRRICYARVSSKNQKEDLEKQIKFLKERCPEYDVLSDIGSGLNFKRKNFIAILDGIMSGDISELVVAHRDRLCRFGFELFARVAEQNNCKLVVLDETCLSPQDELVRDLISIIHVFSCRIYGLRKYTTKISKDKNLDRQGIEEEV
jgi:predicted site-specific integrase-resolvase